MPRVSESCDGEDRAIAGTEDTQSFRTVEPEPPPPPPPGPPPSVLDDLWRWLALLAILAVAAFLVWFFAFHGRSHATSTVPAVVAQKESPAIRRLTHDGYDVRAIRQPLAAPRGTVASQSPGGGSQLPRGSTVTIHVSLGRAKVPPAATTARATTAATTTATAPAASVPDVTGQTAAAGAGQVEAAGFVAQTDPVEGGGTAGSIVQESPPGGTQARAGQTVTLGVAVGASRPEVRIPDVTGQAAAAARAALLQATLTVKTAYAKGKTGVVLSQTPTGSAPAWTQVTVTVGR